MLPNNVLSVQLWSTRGATPLAVAPWIDPDERPKDREGWSAFGRRLSCLSRRLAREGLRFAWHNHEFEFEALPDGSFGIEHALGEDVLIELDLGWLFRAGQDPLIWLDRYEGRLPVASLTSEPRS
jgi:sugar phosphate isomerase/epimerase